MEIRIKIKFMQKKKQHIDINGNIVLVLSLFSFVRMRLGHNKDVRQTDTFRTLYLNRVTS